MPIYKSAYYKLLIVLLEEGLINRQWQEVRFMLFAIALFLIHTHLVDEKRVYF
jgi:hypothetical protein